MCFNNTCFFNAWMVISVDGTLGVGNSFRVSGSSCPSWTLSSCRPMPCGIFVFLSRPRAVTLVTICLLIRGDGQLSSDAFHFEVSSRGVVTFVHSFVIKVHFTLFKPSRKTNVVVELHLGLRRGTPVTACSVVESSLGLERRRVHCTALGRRP